MKTIYVMLEIEATDDVPDPQAAADELRDAIDAAEAWPAWVYTVDGQDPLKPERGSSFRFSRMLSSERWDA